MMRKWYLAKQQEKMRDREKSAIPVRRGPQDYGKCPRHGKSLFKRATIERGRVTYWYLCRFRNCDFRKMLVKRSTRNDV